MVLGQLRGPVWETGTPLRCPNQISIVAHCGLEVCDAGHSWFVMKKVGRQIAEVTTSGIPFIAKNAMSGAGHPPTRCTTCPLHFARVTAATANPPRVI